MKKIIEVIPYKCWKHKSGRTASISGACPWSTDAEKSEWTLETKGFTWLCDDGTRGLGRVPSKTYEEAKEVMERFNARI